MTSTLHPTIAQGADTIARAIRAWSGQGAPVARGTFTVDGTDFVVSFHPAGMVAVAVARNVDPQRRRAVALRGRAIVAAVLHAHGIRPYRTRSHTVDATDYEVRAWGARAQ